MLLTEAIIEIRNVPLALFKRFARVAPNSCSSVHVETTLLGLLFACNHSATLIDLNNVMTFTCDDVVA